MSDNKIFYQDFLFEKMPVDKQDNPIVEIKYIKKVKSDTKYEIISFDRLLKMDKFDEWDALFNRINNSIVYIIDDVSLDNKEVMSYKDFYLKTYFYNVSQCCKECYVVLKDNH